MSVHYEWQIRHAEHDFFEAVEKLSKFTSDAVRMMLTVVPYIDPETMSKKHPEKTLGIRGELILVRHGIGNEARFPYGREPRGDADATSKCVLPTIFNNGLKVPKRFQTELTKWQKRGFR
jgi:hypothetical protein